MRPKGSKAALIQGTILAATIAVVAAALIWEQQRPFDRETLAIEVGLLRSAAAETAALIDNDAAQHLAPAFTRAQADQLSGKVGTVASALRSTPAQPDLRDAHDAAAQMAVALQQVLRLIAANDRSARDNIAATRMLSARAEALARQLKAGQ